MKFWNIKSLLLSVAISILPCGLAMNASATTMQNEKTTTQDFFHFKPRPSVNTRLDFSTWDFMLSETVLYMGPSTRTRASRNLPQTGTRLSRSHYSPYKMEGNKVLYALMNKNVKSEMKAYATELIELGNRLDIPALPKNEQLAFWINLHNAVLITTISDHYPGPKRRPSLIKPIKGSDVTLHDAKLIEIDGYKLSLRDIREKIVFPNWKNGDIPYAFHLGNLGSPSMANTAYNGTDLRAQLARNGYEFVNSLRGYSKGKISPYIRDVSSWYYPSMESKLDNYFKIRMRPEVFAEFKANGIESLNDPELVIADMTGGYGVNGGMERYYSNLRSTAGTSFLGADIEEFLRDRAAKNLQLSKKDWFRRGTVTIEDNPTDGGDIEIK